MNRTYRMSQNSAQSVAQRVKDADDDREKIENGTNPARVTKRKRRESGHCQDGQSQSDEPFAEFESRHRPEAQPLAQSQNGRIVYVEKTVDCFVGNMQSQRHAQADPGKTKRRKDAATSVLGTTARVAMAITSRKYDLTRELVCL
jgi:hypothetical protein